MGDHDRLDGLIEIVTADCYNDSEYETAFYTVFAEEVRFPAEASLLGAPVQVVEIDVAGDGRSLRARCAGRHGDSWLTLADLKFAEDEVAAWLHAAYRRWSGLRPFPYAIPDGWTIDWL